MNLSIVTEAKKVTHVLAVGVAAAVTWAVSDSGQKVIGGVVSAYPKISGLMAAIGVIAALYRKS